MSHGNQNNQGRNNQQPTPKPQTQPQIGLNIVQPKEPEKKLYKTMVKFIDTYSEIEEAALITEQENNGFQHYFVMPFPFGTKRIHYFRKILQ